MLAPQLPAMTQLTQLTRLQQPWDHRIWLTCSVKQSRCSKSLAVKARLNACPTSGASGASSDTWWDLYRYLAGSEKSGRAQMMIWLGQLVYVYIYIYNCIYIYMIWCVITWFIPCVSMFYVGRESVLDVWAVSMERELPPSSASHAQPWQASEEPEAAVGSSKMGGSHMGVSIVMGVPQNGWFIVENLFKIHDNWGYPHDLGNLHICFTNLTTNDGLARGNHRLRATDFRLMTCIACIVSKKLIELQEQMRHELPR